MKFSKKSSTKKFELAYISVKGINTSQIESYDFAQIMLKRFKTQNYISITFAYLCDLICSSILRAIIGGGIPISIFAKH